MESVMVFVLGLGVRLLLFVLLFALFTAPIALLVLAVQGATTLRERATGRVDAGGVRWKPGLAYTTAHAWIKSAWGRTVKVGLDDVARRLLAGAREIALPPPGSRLRQGDPLARIRCGERLVPIPCPVDGIVLERNAVVMGNPSLFEREPYGAGWLLRLETLDAPESYAFRGPDSKAWLRDENARLNRFLETRLGLSAADGGTLTRAPSELLGEVAWQQAFDQFLRAS